MLVKVARTAHGVVTPWHDSFAKMAHIAPVMFDTDTGKIVDGAPVPPVVPTGDIPGVLPLPPTFRPMKDVTPVAPPTTLAAALAAPEPPAVQVELPAATPVVDASVPPDDLFAKLGTN